ncbi:MAG: trypsin-like peptidase domain-containing protein [Coleofasciculus sp. S288]|nr:trypsin-like peptidase domain-containing protein [Coleofasciculus sp. S288]
MAAPLESSVVRIYSKSGKVVGAGFLVSSKHVLTCAHVVTDALGIPRTTQQQPDGVINLDFPLLAAKQLFVAKVIFWQPVNPHKEFEDIAGLELETALPETAQPSQLVTSEDLWGHPFRVLGFPAGQPNGVSASGVLRGRIANGWVQLEDVKQPGYRLEPGFSGAPVWDEELQGVAGMAVAAEMNRADVKAAFIIPTSILVSAWSDLGEKAISSCPYRGLFAFREQDAKFFFGREAFTQQLVAAVQRQHLVAVIGSSGSGKSSVVFAGLIPQLRQQGDWLINSFRPGERPFRNLAATLVPLLEIQMSETDQLVEINKLATAFEQENITLQDVVARILEKNSSTHLLLVADQFEELYTLCRNAEERQLFLEQFLGAVNNKSSLNLVLTLRADFLGYALSYRPFADALQNADVKLGPMNIRELRDAIEKPAQLLGVRIEEGLTERILKDVEKEPGNLPLLEFALTLLWAQQRNGQMTHRAYEHIGGVEKALTRYAEEVYGKLSEADKQVAHQVFIQLVYPGEGTQDTRRLATRAEVGENNWNLVTRLANARLVVTGYDESTSEETVEVVHEALIEGWETLRQWIKENRRFRTWQERLRELRRQWELTGKDDGALLRGVQLTEAEQWHQQRLAELSIEERVFIQLSVALRDREKAEQNFLRRLFLSRLLLISVPVLLMGVYTTYRKARSTLLETSRQNLTESAVRQAESIQESIIALQANLVTASKATVFQSGSKDAYQRFITQLAGQLPTQIQCVELSDLNTQQALARTCNEPLLPKAATKLWPQQQSLPNQDISKRSQVYVATRLPVNPPVSATKKGNSSDSTSQLKLLLSVPVYDAAGQLRYALSIQSALLPPEQAKRGSLSGKPVVINQAGTILTHPYLERIGKNINQEADAEALKTVVSNAISGRQDFQHLFSFEKNGVESLAGYTSISSPITSEQGQKWVILAVTRLESALYGLKDIQQFIMFATCGLITFAFLVALYYSHTLSSRSKNLPVKWKLKGWKLKKTYF